MAYLVEVIHRAHSSGSETPVTAVCLSLKGASEWLMNYFEEWAQSMDFPEDWDEEDMKGAKFPEKSIFSVDNLENLLKSNKQKYYDEPIWAPESEFEAQAPIEFRIKQIPIFE